MPETQPSSTVDLNEIDAILSQATASLDDATTEPSEIQSAQPTAPADAQMQVPEPEAALTQVQENLNNLEQMLADDPAAAASSAPLPAQSPPSEKNNAAATPPKILSTNELDEELQAAFDSLPAIDVDLGESLEDLTQRQAAPSRAAVAIPTSKLVASLTQEAMSLPSKLAHGCMAAAIGLLVLIDKPFGWLGETAKSLIGLVAIATSIMAITVWAAHDLLSIR